MRMIKGFSLKMHTALTGSLYPRVIQIGTFQLYLFFKYIDILNKTKQKGEEEEEVFNLC